MTNQECTFSNLLGGTLNEVKGLYLLNPYFDPLNPLEICLIISGSPIKIRSGPSGEGLSLTRSKLDPLNMGGLGTLVAQDLSSDANFSELLNGTLTSINRVIGRYYRDDLGAIFKFTSGDLCVLNIGDEICIGRNIPPSLNGEVEFEPA